MPTGLEGQIDSLNPLELLWDKYKRFVYGLLIALVAAFGVSYLIDYLDRQATDERWSKIVTSAGLARAYADLPEWNPGRAQFHFMQLESDLLGKLESDLESVDRAALRDHLAAVEGDKVLEPLLLWLVGLRAYFEADWAEARDVLGKLRDGYPKHFLTIESGYPVQWRAEVEKDEDEEKPRSAREKPDLEPAVAGSTVGLMLARIDAEEAFRSDNASFYAAPEPDSETVAVIKLDDADDRFDGEIEIRFYASRAPKHVEAFLAAAREGFFDGLRIHNVSRLGTDPQRAQQLDPLMRPSEFKFGLPITRDEEDRTKWTNASGTVTDEHKVEWEATELSHFPGMLAAEPAPPDKSQIERLVINGDDVAATADGTRVIFGRVVSGLDLVQRLISDIAFQSETDERSGRGVPGDNVRIESVTIR